MVRLTRRLAIYVGSLLALVVLYTLAYRWGMATLEGEQRTWYGALEIVVQSMTTTGYGQDAPWETLEMTALMVLIQLTGIAYIFVAVPLFVVPWLETLVQPTPPEEADALEDHVIVVGYTDLCGSLVADLASTGTDYLVVEEDEERAQDLHQDGLAVLHGDPATSETLDAAQLEAARAVVADTTERGYISTTIAMERRGARVLALVVDPSRARYLRYAGADEVLSPKHRLGKALGDKVRPVVDPGAAGIELCEDLQVREYVLSNESELVGDPLVACRRVEATGATVIGAWVRGDFLRTLSSDVRTGENTTLLVAGPDSTLDAAEELTGTPGVPYRPQREPVVVAGTGIVGSTAVGALERADVETTIVDRRDGDPVDVVADVTTEEGLLDAEIRDAGTIVLALDDDEEAILATLVARELNPGLEIIVASDRERNVGRLRDAGADYALGLPNVAGWMITRRVFEQEVMTFADRVRIRSVDPWNLVGERIDRGAVRDRAGCDVVAIDRDDGLRPVADETRVEADDRLVIAGSEREIERYREAYGES
ncbi:TrkA family potassium uptake protein [Halovivax sp.]|uniref:potassium channel family protein n=1 Tax=Halovivax sp. TaxID=1935978 RepID=UPI0025BF36B7|nr:potassium channel protein [Halovivax sp.]